MSSNFADRDSLAEKLSRLTENDMSVLALVMENPLQDENLIEGLHRHLDLSSKSHFLNSLKLEKLGFWLGNAAPARLQIRLSEASKSSQHPVYVAFRNGYNKSGGLERAYPPA